MLQIIILLLAAGLAIVKGNYHLLSATTGEVYKENFTYYSLVDHGTLLLELTSMSGDCDLYVSQNMLRPTYDLQSYCLQSTTCGLDWLIIPKSFKRPIGVGIFGHPSHEVSQYILTVSFVHDSLDLFYYDYYNESQNSVDSNRRVNTMEVSSDEEVKEESVYWVFLKFLFKLLFEIFFSEGFYGLL